MSTDIDALREFSYKIDDLYSSAKNTEAEELLRQAIEQTEDEEPAYHLFFKGEFAGYVEKDDEKRRELCEQATELCPGDFFLARAMGVSLSILGREEEAIEWFDKALWLNPDDHHSMRERGAAFQKTGHNEEALEWFDKALKINPSYCHALCDTGITLSNLGHYDKALKWFDNTLKINPNYVRAIRNKGAALFKLSHNFEAIECVDKAIWHDPNDAISLYWRAGILLALGRARDALTAAKQAVDLVPSNRDYVSLHNLIAHMLNADRVKAKAPERRRPELDGERKGLALEFDADAPALVRRPLLRQTIRAIHKRMSSEKDALLAQMKKTEERRKRFLAPESALDPNETLFLVLRK